MLGAGNWPFSFTGDNDILIVKRSLFLVDACRSIQGYGIMSASFFHMLHGVKKKIHPNIDDTYIAECLNLDD